MEFKNTALEGVLEIVPKVFEDTRGYFFEAYAKKEFEKAGINFEFVQENESLSNKDVLRGLHFQKRPYAQGKLVRVISGSIRDFVVDIRIESPTYSKWISYELNSENKKMLWIPEGFAHGFLTLENNSIIQYKLAEYYNKSFESGIIWNDPDLKIDWGIKDPILSEKDSKHPLLRTYTDIF
ncbi:MAG: dTDP-4-dehydrorhamnose 3,5-epimerase [Nanoarchaeota archaeon]